MATQLFLATDKVCRHTSSESRFSEDGERLTFSFLCYDMQLSYYGPLWSPFNLMTAVLLSECVTKYSRTVCAMYVVQNFALVAGGFYATGRSTAIIVYHWKVKSYYCTVYHWKVKSYYCTVYHWKVKSYYCTVYHWKLNSNYCKLLEGQQEADLCNMISVCNNWNGNIFFIFLMEQNANKIIQ
jgi:hypothetical protein